MHGETVKFEETAVFEGLWSGQTRHTILCPSCGPSFLPCRHTAVFDIVHRTVTRGLTDPFCVSVQWLGHYNGRNEQRNEKREREKKVHTLPQSLI